MHAQPGTVGHPSTNPTTDFEFTLTVKIPTDILRDLKEAYSLTTNEQAADRLAADLITQLDIPTLEMAARGRVL